MNILSIQSHVAYGHVGNDAATFPLQRLGIEVWPIHTVQFSNHTGYGAWRGRVFDADLIREIMDGVDDRGVLPRCDGVLSGYVGSAETAEAILDAAKRVKRANTRALYCCDPVIGDIGRGVFVRDDIPDLFRSKIVPAADIITPNHFELDHLSARRSVTLGEARAAIDALHDLGPRVILVTSLHTRETPEAHLDVIVSDRSGLFRLRTPLLPLQINGAGDAIAALFLAHYLKTESAAEAMSRAVSSVFGVLRRTAERGEREIMLVAAQEELVRPSQVFEAQAIG